MDKLDIIIVLQIGIFGCWLFIIYELTDLYSKIKQLFK